MRVSCVMATMKGRKHFLEKAIKYWSAQTLPDSELLVVDDDPNAEMEITGKNVRYFHHTIPISIGEKLNFATQRARAQVVVKIDDDDYYSPDFLETLTTAYTLTPDWEDKIAHLSAYLHWNAKDRQVRFAGYNVPSTNSLCFHKKLWERSPFDHEVGRADKRWFEKRGERVLVNDAELCLKVIHGPVSYTVSALENPVYKKQLRQLLSAEDAAFYESLMGP